MSEREQKLIIKGVCFSLVTLFLTSLSIFHVRYIISVSNEIRSIIGDGIKVIGPVEFLLGLILFIYIIAGLFGATTCFLGIRKRLPTFWKSCMPEDVREYLL